MHDEQRPRPAGRLGVTGCAALGVLQIVVLPLVFALALVSAILVAVWIGVLLLLVAVPAVRAVADLNRWVAGRVLGEPVPSPYQPLPPGPVDRLRAQAADPMTWRDLVWLLWAMTVGFLVSLLVVLLFLAVVTLPVWWYGAVPLMRARATVDRALLSHGRTEQLEQRVQVLADSRADAVDHSAAELRRIERDLHDGPQARLAALSLNLGLADEVFETDPETARRLVIEARHSSTSALGDLRNVVRGIHPPVLADRGLVGAVEALAVAMAIPVDVSSGLSGRAPAPVESAVYFAVAECLANVAKHAGAAQAWVDLSHRNGVLTAVVGDDGVGGADPRTGSGLRGIADRLAVFDGTLRLSSPPRGPTVVTLEVPCALSSPKTTPSSGPG